jgi:hypothetical protein
MSAGFEATKSSKEVMSAAMIKDATIERNAQRHRGFVLHHTKITWDAEKLAQGAQNIPNGAGAMKALMGESINTWYGTDGKVVLSVAAPDWAKAKELIDAYFDGKGTVGQSAGYRAVRSKLPDRVSSLFLVSAQGLVRMMSGVLSATAPDNPALKAPADLPKEPALFGGTSVSSPEGIEFETFIPSGVGPVFEKGLVPLFQGMAGQVNQ